MKAAIYARVSTDDKDQNPETQLRILRKLAESRGMTIFREYVDEGWSGADKGRPGMIALRRDAKAHRFDVLMAQSDDRLWRDTVPSIEFVNELLGMKPPIGIVFANQSFDLEDPTGMTQYELSAVFSSWFRRQNSKKVKQGLARVRAEGKTLGRPRVNLDIETVILVLEAGGVKSRLAGDLRVSQGTINKYLHDAGRDDLVGKDYKRAPILSKRPAKNLPLENEEEYIKNEQKEEPAQNTCFMQAREGQ
ncbi:MAG: recombinase family protein [Methanomassiliicoccus sp.]|nr:recombinase family protein [Methanomassiliicoccus sp.]